MGGTCTNKGLRDLIFALLAMTRTELDTIGAAPMGDIAPGDWDEFRDAADAMYAALEFIAPGYRTDLLAGLGWTR